MSQETMSNIRRQNIQVPLAGTQDMTIPFLRDYGKDQLAAQARIDAINKANADRAIQRGILDERTEQNRIANVRADALASRQSSAEKRTQAEYDRQVKERAAQDLLMMSPDMFKNLKVQTGKDIPYTPEGIAAVDAEAQALKDAQLSTGEGWNGIKTKYSGETGFVDLENRDEAIKLSKERERVANLPSPRDPEEITTTFGITRQAAIKDYNEGIIDKSTYQDIMEAANTQKENELSKVAPATGFMGRALTPSEIRIENRKEGTNLRTTKQLTEERRKKKQAESSLKSREKAFAIKTQKATKKEADRIKKAEKEALEKTLAPYKKTDIPVEQLVQDVQTKVDADPRSKDPYVRRRLIQDGMAAINSEIAIRKARITSAAELETYGKKEGIKDVYKEKSQLRDAAIDKAYLKLKQSLKDSSKTIDNMTRKDINTLRIKLGEVNSEGDRKIQGRERKDLQKTVRDWEQQNKY